jgi:hypothetical protein
MTRRLKRPATCARAAPPGRPRRDSDGAPLQAGGRRPVAAACFSSPSTPPQRSLQLRSRGTAQPSMRRPSMSATPPTYDRTTPLPT